MFKCSSYQQQYPEKKEKTSILSFDFKLTVKIISSTISKKANSQKISQRKGNFMQYDCIDVCCKNLYSLLRIFFVIVLVYKYRGMILAIVLNATQMVYWCFINKRMLNQIHTFIGCQTYNTALDNAWQNSLVYSIHVPLLLTSSITTFHKTKLKRMLYSSHKSFLLTLWCDIDTLVQLISHAKGNCATCGTPVTCSSYRFMSMYVDRS